MLLDDWCVPETFIVAENPLLFYYSALKQDLTRYFSCIINRIALAISLGNARKWFLDANSFKKSYFLRQTIIGSWKHDTKRVDFFLKLSNVFLNKLLNFETC